MDGTVVYVKEGLPFACNLSLDTVVTYIVTYVFDQLYITQCLTSFSSIGCLLCLCIQFLIPISSNKDEVFIHHKDWLTYSDGTN